MPSISTQGFTKDKKRLDLWRAQRPQRDPIPDRLWKLAASHVEEYGVQQWVHALTERARC